MDGTEQRRAIVRHEAIIAATINVIIGVAAFYMLFGWSAVAASDLAIGFLPQTLAMSVVGTLIPSLVLRVRIARGDVFPAGPVPPLRRHMVRIAGVAMVAVVVFGGPAALLTLALAPASVEPLPAILANAVYSAGIGALVTPPVIRAVLGMPMFDGRAPAAEIA